MELFEFMQLPCYLQEDAIYMAIENENGIHDYDAENVSDDFVFVYDEDNDELIDAVYRRYDDGGIAFLPGRIQAALSAIRG